MNTNKKQNPYKIIKIIFIVVSIIGVLAIATIGTFLCLLSSSNNQDYSVILITSIIGLIGWPTIHYLVFLGMNSENRSLITIYWIYVILLLIQIPIGTLLGYLIIKTKKNADNQQITKAI
jgi:hypothetical protein